MRACRMPLAEIRQLLDGSDTDAVGLLARHLEELRAQERQVKEAIARTRAAMELLEGVSRMGTREGFEELKQRRLEEFESSYGDEARRRYGADVIDQTNERLMGLSQEEWNEKDRIEKRIIELLAEAKADGDPRGPKAQELCLLHQRWIKIHWGEESYSTEAHCGLARLYLADPRFIDYYDGAAGTGATEFLVAALEANL
ncbi:MerR family transcriptional regulator [Olsenella phocaeensis]|uniref:MerR family transcriptional regulator n=1 Tax=Olsenella phocaeensis TaxID=1852385 RepID=UPI0038994E84